MQVTLKLLDVVALDEDVPERKLLRGMVGTIVEVLAPDAYEVEFCGDDGRAYMTAALNASQLMLLYFGPPIAAWAGNHEHTLPHAGE